jgi:hypothetical protein
MARVAFISETYIKDNSFIDENVDVNLLRSEILDVQELRILPILGTGLFDELKTQITANTVTALNRTLLNDYVKPALKFWVLFDSALIFTFKITNKSIYKKTAENSETVATTDLDRIMDYCKIRAEFYSERITKYLIQNCTSYPLYENSGDGYDTIHPNNNNYTQGIYLGVRKVNRKYD